MTVDAAPTGTADASRPAYARFPRRLRAVVVDSIFCLLVIIGALSIAVAVGSDRFSRLLGFAVAALLVLYEPLLVWLAGSSIGHYLTNLRVVDSRSRGNVSFVKALARLLIKTVLGWYSFITMATTRRHQALHDLLTGSTVQIRDPARARPHHFAHERVEFSNPGMPSRAWRALVIVAYLVVALGLAFAAVNGLIAGGGLSRVCLYYDRCSPGENLLLTSVGLLWLASCLLIIVQGWRGRLPGGRARQLS